MKTVKCYEASDGKLFKATDFEEYKVYETVLKIRQYFPELSFTERDEIVQWVGSDHFYEVFPLYKDLGVTTQNVGD